jgi:hypothetical protein
MGERLPWLLTAGGVAPAAPVGAPGSRGRSVFLADPECSGGPDPDPDQAAVRLSALRRLYRLIGRVNGARQLPEVLQSVVDGVVQGLGFGVAAVNLAHEDASFEVAAVAGSEEARQALVGLRVAASTFDEQFAAAECWGSLRFVPHGRLPADALDGWVPSPADLPVVDAADAWHPLDALFAPLRAPSGDLVGILSVDLPEDGRRPGALQCELLEMYAAQAGIAVDNARLAERLRASEASFRLAFDGSACGMMMTGLDPRDPGRLLRARGETLRPPRRQPRVGRHHRLGDQAGVGRDAALHHPGRGHHRTQGRRRRAGPPGQPRPPDGAAEPNGAARQRAGRARRLERCPDPRAPDPARPPPRRPRRCAVVLRPGRLQDPQRHPRSRVR